MTRAIVIGAGIGGSAAALLLAKSGLKTTLLEKNPRIGGSCSGYTKHTALGDFHCDIGTHMFCRGDKGPLGEVLRRVGHGGVIPFRRTRDIAELRTVGADGVLNRIPVPARLHRMPAFSVQMARALDLSPREMIEVGRLFTHILTMSDDAVVALDHVTVEDFVAPYANAEAVLSVFAFLLGLYFVLPYWEVSAGEALWCFRRMALDNSLSYPVGGSIAIPRTYCDLAESYGAVVRVNTGVKRIVVEANRVRGVLTSEGEMLEAEVVISTSSLRTTVLGLVGEDVFPTWYVDRIRGLKASHIAVQAKIGLDAKLVAPGAIVGGVGHTDLFRLRGDRLKDMYRCVESGRVPDVVPFYCPVPTNFDPGLAPNGCQLLTVCAVAPTSDVGLVDRPELWEKAMMHALRTVVPGLDAHTVFIDKFSVKFIERWIGKEFGPAISTGQTPDQVGARRPPVFTPVTGLYAAGCCAGARGVGTELAAASAMMCADRVLADLGRLIQRPPERGRRRNRIVRQLVRPVSWATAASVGPLVG